MRRAAEQRRKHQKNITKKKILSKYSKNGKMEIRMGEIYIDGQKNEEATAEYHKELVKSGVEKEGQWEKLQDEKLHPEKYQTEHKDKVGDTFDKLGEPKQAAKIKPKTKLTPNESNQKKKIEQSEIKNTVKTTPAPRERVIEKSIVAAEQSPILQKEVQNAGKEKAPIVIQAPAPEKQKTPQTGESQPLNATVVTADGSHFGNKLYGAY